MATKGRLDLKGMAQWLETLAEAGADVDEAAARALEAGAAVAEAGMQARVPVDTHNLQNHIGMDGPHRSGNYTFVDVGVLRADPDTARYGNAQEYLADGQPYIRPTMDEDAGKIRAAMRESLQKDGKL